MDDARAMAVFAARCAELHIDPDLPFVEGWIWSRIVDGAGVTLMGGRLVDPTGPERFELAPDEAATIAILAGHVDSRAQRQDGRWIPARPGT